MATLPTGTVSVTFIAQRTEADEAGYALAATAMDALAARQNGYLGVDSVRGADGLGITVSYWESEAHARAWRDHPDHASIRNAGRGIWYAHYSLHVAKITRSYDWERR
jgi:heme-degrading monooxygenase HmoA